ncbi:hypothetical protein PFISCL1PPCAC_23628, partial [Pristionchus fissidentatus]
ELELGTTEGLNGVVDVLLSQTDGEEEIADVNAGDKSVGLSVSSTHTGLKTISTGARKHLVDADNVVRVLSDTHVEGVLSAVLDEVLVGANASSLKSLRGEMLTLVGDHVHASGELVNGGSLSAEIEDSDLSIGDSSAETRLGVRLVLDVPVASCRSATHVLQI